MTPEQKRAYVLSDNKLALNAGWDEELLAEELQALMSVDDLDFDIGVTGFDLGEFDKLITRLEVEEPGDPKDDILPIQAPRRVQLGDVWRLGQHRLACGDAIDANVVGALMQGEPRRSICSGHSCDLKRRANALMPTCDRGKPPFDIFSKSTGACRQPISESQHQLMPLDPLLSFDLCEADCNLVAGAHILGKKVAVQVATLHLRPMEFGTI